MGEIFDAAQVAATYDRIAAAWDSAHSDDDWWVAPAERFLSLVPDGPIIDVGCGSGVKARYIIDRGRAVVGVDASIGLINLARKRAPEAKFYQLDLMRLGELREKFSGAFAQAVLLHIPKEGWPKALAAIRSVIVPGGWLYLSVKERWPGQPEEEVKERDLNGERYSMYYSYWTKAGVQAAVADAGFNRVEVGVAAAGPTNWIYCLAQNP